MDSRDDKEKPKEATPELEAEWREWGGRVEYLRDPEHEHTLLELLKAVYEAQTDLAAEKPTSPLSMNLSAILRVIEEGVAREKGGNEEKG